MVNNQQLEYMWRVNSWNDARIRWLAIAMEHHLHDDAMQQRLQEMHARALVLAFRIESAITRLLWSLATGGEL